MTETKCPHCGMPLLLEDSILPNTLVTCCECSAQFMHGFDDIYKEKSPVSKFTKILFWIVVFILSMHFSFPPE